MLNSRNNVLINYVLKINDNVSNVFKLILNMRYLKELLKYGNPVSDIRIKKRIMVHL